MEIQIQNGFQIPFLTVKLTETCGEWPFTLRMSGKHTGPQPSSCGESIFLLGPQAQKWIKQAHHVFTGMWSGQSRSQVMGISIVGHQCLVTHPQMEADSYCLHFEELRLRKMRWCVSVRQLAGSRLCYGVHSPPSAVSTSWRGSHCVTGQGHAQCRDLEFEGYFWWLPLSLSELMFSLWCSAFQNICIDLVDIFREPDWLPERMTMLTNMESMLFMCHVVLHMPFIG